VEASAALGQAGEVQIELIQQDSPGPSFYRDAIPEGAEGLHHIALVVEDLDAEVRRLEALGIPTAARIEFGGMRVAHMDTVARLGFMIELIERNTASETLFQMTHSASTEWDGRDPLRPVAGFQPA
jgi:catechol 2,3-dioxygenase-like lactoylglutathione lyase family enzyme